MWETDKITIYGEFITEAYGQGSEMAIHQCRGSAITPDGHYHLPVSAENAYVEINLGLHLGPQLKRAEQLLRKLQDDFKREHPELMVSKRKRERHYRTYLQLLDAEEAGASRDEMAAVLFPHLTNCHPTYNGRKAVENNLAAAKRLRDGGYRFL
jgi:hypothetical protein